MGSLMAKIGKIIDVILELIIGKIGKKLYVFYTWNPYICIFLVSVVVCIVFGIMLLLLIGR